MLEKFAATEKSVANFFAQEQFIDYLVRSNAYKTKKIWWTYYKLSG